MSDESTPFVSPPMNEKHVFNLPHLPKKKVLLIAGAVLGLIILGVVVALLMRGGSSDEQEEAVAISNEVAYVTIEQATYTPATITIKKGQQITWTNNLSMPRRLTADQESLPGFETPEPLNQGDTYTYTFTKSGSFHYYDPDDPKTYVGTINVK